MHLAAADRQGGAGPDEARDRGCRRKELGKRLVLAVAVRRQWIALAWIGRLSETAGHPAGVTRHKTAAAVLSGPGPTAHLGSNSGPPVARTQRRSAQSNHERNSKQKPQSSAQAVHSAIFREVG
jgi:hypothetical protein